MAAECLPVGAAVDAGLGGVAHCGPDRDEFQMFAVFALTAPLQAHADDPVCLHGVGLGLHAGHSVPAGPVGRLGQDGQFALLAQAAGLEADVVDRHAHDQVDRFEAGAAQQGELVDGQVGGENRAGVGEAFLRDGVH